MTITPINMSRNIVGDFIGQRVDLIADRRDSSGVGESAPTSEVKNFHGLTPHTAARLLDRIQTRRSMVGQTDRVSNPGETVWDRTGIFSFLGLHQGPTSIADPGGLSEDGESEAEASSDGAHEDSTPSGTDIPETSDENESPPGKEKKLPAAHPWNPKMRLPVDKFPLPEEGEDLWEHFDGQDEHRQNYWIDTGIPPWGKEIHHAVEQDMWKILEGVFHSSEKHMAWNLRGIWGSDAAVLHQSNLRVVWNMIYSRLRELGLMPPLNRAGRPMSLSREERQRLREALIFWAMVVDLLFGLKFYPKASLVEDPDFFKYLLELGLTPEEIALLEELLKNKDYEAVQRILQRLLQRWDGKVNPFRKFTPSVRPTMPRYAPRRKRNGGSPDRWDDEDDLWEKEFREIAPRPNAVHPQVVVPRGGRGARTPPPILQRPDVPSEAPPVPEPDIRPTSPPAELPGTGTGQPEQPGWQPPQQPGLPSEQEPEPSRPQENPAPAEPPRPQPHGAPEGYRFYPYSDGYQLKPLNEGNPSYPNPQDLPDPPLGQGWIFDGRYMNLVPLPPDQWYDPRYKLNLLPPLPLDTHWEHRFGLNEEGKDVVPEWHVVPNIGVHPLHGERQWYPRYTEPPGGWKWHSNGKGGWYLRIPDEKEKPTPDPGGGNGSPKLDWRDIVLFPGWSRMRVPFGFRAPLRFPMRMPMASYEGPTNEVPEVEAEPETAPAPAPSQVPRWDPAPSPRVTPAPAVPQAPAVPEPAPAPTPQQPPPTRPRPDPSTLV
ncbi:hypothetical protein OG225_07420 [Nocardia sp. NBC_01377]|uniref:hypothetical protein n=1 Tax=Nocardia sp. NBC_01377 TaxID=2903595 RepID=UPI00324C5524